MQRVISCNTRSISYKLNWRSWGTQWVKSLKLIKLHKEMSEYNYRLNLNLYYLVIIKHCFTYKHTFISIYSYEVITHKLAIVTHTRTQTHTVVAFVSLLFSTSIIHWGLVFSSSDERTSQNLLKSIIVFQVKGFNFSTMFSCYVYFSNFFFNSHLPMKLQ